MKVSFIIPCHNEEENIRKCLDNLENYKKKEDEIIVGLDACTDKTEEYVRLFGMNFIKSEQNIGKHGILKKLIKKSHGEIIIIHDADWFLSGQKPLSALIKYFDDKKVGGIANSFSMTFANRKICKGIAYLGDVWCDYFLNEFKKTYYTKRENGILYVDEKKMFFPFFLNVIRREIITEAITGADDLERVLDIIRKGYKIVVLEDEEIPHQVVQYNYISLPNLYKQKLRGHLARKQIKRHYNYSTSVRKFYLPMTIFLLRKMLKIHSIKMVASMSVWIGITAISYIHALILNSMGHVTTERLWKEMRIR